MDHEPLESSFSNSRRYRWFCNMPLSPVCTSTKVQDTTITSSDESQEKILSNTVDKEIVTSDEEPDPIDDPDFEPESDCSTDISLSSPQIMCTPPSSVDSVSQIEEHDEYMDSIVDPNNVNNQIENTETREIDTSEIVGTVKTNVTKFKKAVFCYYCESYVTNFPRHITRNHKTEIDVQKILALPPISKERKKLLFALRKKGNYLTSSQVTKPVRSGGEKSNYLPCVHCLGFYSSRNLWRHRKQCDANPLKGTSTKNSQSDAQNFLIRHLKVDTQLKTNVFPRMRADQISLVAKKDPLICAFASRYLKIHREQHFVLVASRKMRELARLLIELRKLKPQIKDLFGALRAENYDLLVSATKTASKYDLEIQRYQAPTFALHMGTTLKQCCDIALMHALKKSDIFPTIESANFESELKTLIQLIQGNWKFDVSSQAASDLNLQKWNKVSLVPLAADLKLLKECLIVNANAALLKLKENNGDAKSYSILLETVYCRLILLNRRRPGELQRLLVNTYHSAISSENMQGYEEFSEAITETEKILMNNFKRIVIRGKRGRGVPVLISKDLQEHLNILMACRNDVFKTPNIYLFANPKSGEAIVGYKVLKKYAALSGAKNPDALTCTRLRKHLATLTQLFNMNENDMEQLASFMGHTLGIHRSSYRLPDDVYQTAKISKLLILMERGEAGQFKGKSLDEIDLNLDKDLMEESEGFEEQVEDIFTEGIENDVQGGVEDAKEVNYASQGNKKIDKKVSGRKRLIVPWTEQQKNIVTDFFETHIKQKRPPRKGECEALISEYPEVLKNKNWLKIKVFVQNKYKKN